MFLGKNLEVLQKLEKSVYSKQWPVPNSYLKHIPEKGEPGSFWEDRDDRRHCGVDIYAPEGAIVVAIESGVVIDSGVFTDPTLCDYHNRTYYVVIKSKEKINYKYAEILDVSVSIGEFVEVGTTIGKIGSVVNIDMLGPDSPFYIRELAHKGNPSMLHLELYKAPIIEVRPYQSGNFFGKDCPASLIDPTYFLNGKIKPKDSRYQLKN